MYMWDAKTPSLTTTTHIYMYIVLLCRLTAQGLLLLLLLRTWFQSCQTYSHGATKKERARGAVADCAATWQRHLFFTNFSNQRFQSLFNATLFKYLGIPSNFLRKSLVCKCPKESGIKKLLKSVMAEIYILGVMVIGK